MIVLARRTRAYTHEIYCACLCPTLRDDGIATTNGGAVTCVVDYSAGSAMSKKRGRSRGGEDAFSLSEAEAMLFEVAPNVGDSSNVDVKRPSEKRIKMSPSKDDITTVEGTDTKVDEGLEDENKMEERARGLENSSGTPKDGASPRDLVMAPTSALRHCDGFDIVRKGTRGKSKQLMVLPGVLGLGSAGGALGTLKNVNTSSPILYVEFPEVCAVLKSLPLVS